jgi:hypothetical protein
VLNFVIFDVRCGSFRSRNLCHWMAEPNLRGKNSSGSSFLLLHCIFWIGDSRMAIFARRYNESEYRNCRFMESVKCLHPIFMFRI